MTQTTPASKCPDCLRSTSHAPYCRRLRSTPSTASPAPARPAAAPAAQTEDRTRPTPKQVRYALSLIREHHERNGGGYDYRGTESDLYGMTRREVSTLIDRLVSRAV